MAATARATPPDSPHTPVLLGPLLTAVAPVEGRWLDGTFGAGGYARGLLDAGADEVIGVDRDPAVFELAKEWAGAYGDRLKLVQGRFSELDDHAGGPLDGVVLDLGVSSMQLDQPERGFSFMADGPLDMRMSQEGPTAADIVNEASEAELADILFHYGEERAARRIAKAIVKARQSHPATRSFQALRIAVNDEFGELVSGLEAAERALKPGGRLAVVSFHSLEDRVVKRVLQSRSGGGGRGSRHAPEIERETPRFASLGKSIEADAEERERNPRARSARLRVARRTDVPAGRADRDALGLPKPANASRN